MALTALDRCDRCMAHAVVTADYWTWATALLFCGCYREHSAALTLLGALITDDRETEGVTP